MSSHFSRRDFLVTLSATAVACVSAQSCASDKSTDAANTSKLNILFVLADDLGKEWVSAYGAEDIETPNIDALASGGIKFNNAYSMAICGPSRITLLTGQYPWTTGWTLNKDLPRHSDAYFDWKQPRNTTFARLMKDLGYATCIAGKWQINDFSVEPDVLEKHGFDEWCVWVGTESGFPGKINRHWEPYVNTEEGIEQYTGQFAADIYTDYLIDFMKRNSSKPMCLYYPMDLIHGPEVPTPDEPDVTTPLDQNKAMVRYVDKMVGKLVQTLDDLGIRDRTLIIFSTDNGTNKSFTATLNGREVQGGKGGKTEQGVCAPFIVSCPSVVPAGVETDALTDFTDLLPTFVELGGGQVPDDLVVDGVSIAPFLRGLEQDTPRTWIASVGGGSELGSFTRRVIRDKQYKVLVSNKRKISELYDLKADPWEEKNLIESTQPAHTAAISKFQSILDTFPATDATPAYEPRDAKPVIVPPEQEKVKKEDREED